MRVISLASGSKGNATLVGEGTDWLLIDDGLSYRTLVARMKSVLGGEAPALCGVLLTHSHTDHISGLAVFHRHHPEVPIFANPMTAEAVSACTKVSDDAFCCFENGQDFEVGPFAAHPFSIPHDTSDPVAYLVRFGGVTYFHGTDIGTPLDSIGLKFGEADLATLESNHDAVMLRTSDRAPSLIQRIAGPRGHLSNDQACDLVRVHASPRLKRLALAHLSRDCNVPRIAEAAMRGTLLEMNRSDISLKVYSQDDIVEL